MNHKKKEKKPTDNITFAKKWANVPNLGFCALAFHSLLFSHSSKSSPDLLLFFCKKIRNGRRLVRGILEKRKLGFRFGEEYARCVGNELCNFITNQITKNMTNEVLFDKSASILLIEERENSNIIIAAPHHTIGGVKYMPCPEHPDGDENTGLIARQIAEQLKLSSVIACNYRVDPNKSLNTDYSVQIAKWKPKYLIEIHGHGARKVNVNDLCIEISSGTINRNENSKKFAITLKNKLQSYDFFKDYKVCGDFNHIHFKATQTATIVDMRWIPIHIELPPSIRIDKDNKLPIFTNDFIKCLSDTISEVCK